MQRIYSYGYLLAAACRATERSLLAETNAEDTLIENMNAVLLCALTLEAFLNHIGEQIIPCWAPLKRKLSPKKKLEVIAAHKSINLKWAEAPLQSFTAVMEFRNLIAHAETEDVEPKSGELSDIPQAKWQLFCTPISTKRIYKDTRSIVENYPSMLGIATIPPFLLSERLQDQ